MARQHTPRRTWEDALREGRELAAHAPPASEDLKEQLRPIVGGWARKSAPERRTSQARAA